METAQRNCRFLSLVVVERALNIAATKILGEPKGCLTKGCVSSTNIPKTGIPKAGIPKARDSENRDSEARENPHCNSPRDRDSESY